MRVFATLWLTAMCAVAAHADSSLLEYLQAHPLTPEDYIVSKFREHDVVFVGEMHRIQHDPQLIARVIPLVYKAGVTRLAFEFARREDQPLLDQLLRSRRWDESLAHEILFRAFAVWGYQEYVDVLHAAWQLNRSLPRRAPQFRVLAVGDSPDWSLIKQPSDEDNPEIRMKVWRGGGETFWAKVVLDEVASGRKVLAYCGIHHAFTKYSQPVVANGRFIRMVTDRFGKHVRDAIGDRAFTIYLHAPWPDSAGSEDDLAYAADGAIDALIPRLPPNLRRAGFDTAGTPFGDLTGEQSIYHLGYDHFRLADFCDGYIIQGPLAGYRGVTPIPGFVNETNLSRAQQGVPNPRARNRSAKEFMEGIASDADMQRRFRRLIEAR